MNQILNIGRSSENQIVINDVTKIISKKHAIFEINNGNYYITDLSTNGTFVNGKKISKGVQIKINHGDSILFANQYSFDWRKVPKKNNDSFKIIEKINSNKLIISLSIIVLIIIATLFFFKNSKYNSQKLYEKYNSSVVLIYHSYFYTVEIDNSPAVYIGINNKGLYDYSLNKSDLSPIASEGTGFFISNEGKLITNRHVAFPWTSNEDDSEFKITNPKLYSVYNKIMKDINKYLNKKNLGHLKRKLSGETKFIGIATNNSFVNSIDDFEECTSIKYHNDYEIDLALIQMNNKRLPKNAKIITKNMFSNKISVGEMATIIGYPGGSNFQTKKGNSTELRVITNEGPVTQKPGSKKVMYQVPTTHGASGSPVFNNKGKLIAVNFSGYKTQGFNYGVLVKYIDDLIK